MFPALFLPSLLLTQAPAQPAAPDPAAVHARFKDKAIAAETLKKQAAAAIGCRADEEGSNSNAYPELSRKADSKVITGSFISPPTTSNPIPEVDRVPLFTPPEQRKDASAFAFALQSEKPVSVADLKGSVVVVFLFNPTCTYTGEAMPEIVRLQGLQAKRPFRIIPVSVGTEGWSGLDRYRKANRGGMPPEFQMFRPTGVSGTGISNFPDFRFTPTTYILDRQGRIAWRVTGAVAGSLTDKLNHIMSEP